MGRARLLRAARAAGRHAFVAVPFAFYGATAARSMGIADSAILMDAIRDLRLSTHVNNHPLTVLIGALFAWLPGRNHAFEANLMSAVVGALAVVAFYGLLLRALRSRAAAAASAALLMVSHSMWWHSTIAESYALNALFTVAAIHLLWALRFAYRERQLLALFLLAGLAIFNHVQLGIIGVGAAVFLAIAGAARLRAGQGRAALGLVARCSAACLLGLAPWLATFAVDVSHSGTVSGSLRWALGGSFQDLMFEGSLASGLRDLAVLTVQQFPSPHLLAIAWGAAVLVRRLGASPSLAALAAMFVLNCGFFTFYTTWDKFAFLLPSFVILAFCGAFGIDAWVRWLSRGRRTALAAASLAAFTFSLLFPIQLYARLAEWGRESGFWYHPFGNFPARNTDDRAAYIANPNKRSWRDVEEFAMGILRTLPPDAIYVDSDFHHFYPIEYFQKHEGLRPDLRLFLVNSWEIPGWGLGEKRFRALLDGALERRRDLFLVSVGDPFARLLIRAWPDVKYRFVRHPLDERRWVYRLVGEEEARAALAGPDGAARVHDFTRADVVSQNSLDLVEDQPMYRFGDAWANHDHAFVRANHPGASVTFRFPAEAAEGAVLALALTRADNFGIVDIDLNGWPVRTGVDLYAPTAGVTILEVPGVRLAAGDNFLTVRITGKNERSVSYRVGIDRVEVRSARDRVGSADQTRGNLGGRFSRYEDTPSAKSGRPKLSSISRTAFPWASASGSSSAS